jgi:hypothetical protein
MHNLDVHRSLAETVKLHGAALAQRLAQESNHGKGACGEPGWPGSGQPNSPQLVWFMYTCSQVTKGRHLVTRSPQLSLSHSRHARVSTSTERARLWRNGNSFCGLLLHHAGLARELNHASNHALAASPGPGWGQDAGNQTTPKSVGPVNPTAAVPTQLGSRDTRALSALRHA